MNTRDSFAAWWRETHPANEEQRIQAMRERISRETGVPAELLAGDTEDSCRAYAAQLRAYTGPTYPSLSDGSVDPSTRGQDSRSARDKFSDWVAGQRSYNPFRRSGGGDTWHI